MQIKKTKDFGFGWFIDGCETICYNQRPFWRCMIDTNIITSRYVLVTMRSRIDIQYSSIDIYFSSLPDKRNTPRTIALSPYRTECSDSPLRPGLRGAMRGWARPRRGWRGPGTAGGRTGTQSPV